MNRSAIWAMMSAFYGLALANIFLRSTMGVLAPELAADLDLSPRELGIVASAFFLSYALMQIPTGLTLDRFGPRATLTALFSLTVIGTFLFAIVSDTWLLILARALMGAGCAGIFAGGFMVIARFYPAERMTSIGGLWNSFAMLGTLLATVPLAFLVAAIGWRTSFVYMAAAAGALALLTGLVVRDAPPTRRAEEIQARPTSLRDVLVGLRIVLRVPGILPIASAGLALSAGNTLLGIWGGPYLNDSFGLDQVQRGEVLIFMAVAGAVGHFLYGELARWMNSIKYVILAGAVCIVVIMALLAAIPDPSLFWVTVLLALLGLACGFPSLLLVHARLLVPDHLSGRGLTVVNTGVMLAIAAMQISVGAIIGFMSGLDGGTTPATAYRGAFAFVAVMAVLSLLCYARAPDIKPFNRT